MVNRSMMMLEVLRLTDVGFSGWCPLVSSGVQCMVPIHFPKRPLAFFIGHQRLFESNISDETWQFLDDIFQVNENLTKDNCHPNAPVIISEVRWYLLEFDGPFFAGKSWGNLFWCTPDRPIWLGFSGRIRVGFPCHRTFSDLLGASGCHFREEEKTCHVVFV